eukprot:gnl/TRDRNA2_/TRDRNA2_94600_c0_seq1.p1 gnl/TRDRNA2_/TRDRNA2_94600_c0~~gnl/TRDRNA2_/TRDRNA2_94600_c0_seq1.p1  ORF type:complete len:136 (+),score=11.64 gnl/TRDRNA2_/TRDRNA2_94600_c0_seq1:3-410(+)
MVSRTPSADGLVPRSVRLSVDPGETYPPAPLAETTFGPQNMPAVPPRPPPLTSLPASAAAPLSSARGDPSESYRSAQSSGRISSYMTQIDNLIAELDSQVKKGKPARPAKSEQKPQEPDRPAAVPDSMSSIESSI